MSFDLRQGFRLGPWKIEPLRGAITGSNGQTQHLEPKVMDVFVCLAERANELVTRDELLDAVWHEHTAADELLTGAISDLRHALQDGRNDPQYIETVPKRGYRLAGQVLPLAESGFKKRVFRQRTLWAVGGALVATMAVLAGLNVGGLRDRLSGGTPPGPVTSIAVLPFVNLSSDEEQEWFADGLTEEILNALAQLPELDVRPRTSSFFFKDQNVPVPEIAARLSVAHIVAGSVRRDGNRLRVTVQLIRASDEFQLWSQAYDRTLDDVFAVQQDIAEHVASSLGVVLDDNARQIMRSAGIRDVDAFIAYQKGLKAFADAHSSIARQRSGMTFLELLASANVFFDQALEAAPGLTAARLMKADLRGHIVTDIANGYREEQYDGEAQHNLTAYLDELYTAIRQSAPGNQRDILEVERTLWSGDWSNLPNLIPRALQPTGCVQMMATAEMLAPFGWVEQLAEKLRDMLACDPMDFETNYNLSSTLLWAGDAEAALRAVDEAARRGLHHGMLRRAEFSALLATGRVEDAKVIPTTSRQVRKILHQSVAGDPELARKMAEDYWASFDDDWYALWLAAVVGDREKANQIAARMDSRTNGFILLVDVVQYCYCGAPFDLEETPNLKSRIEEAGFPWPPPKVIDFPMKRW